MKKPKINCVEIQKEDSTLMTNVIKKLYQILEERIGEKQIEDCVLATTDDDRILIFDDEDMSFCLVEMYCSDKTASLLADTINILRFGEVKKFKSNKETLLKKPIRKRIPKSMLRYHRYSGAGISVNYKIGGSECTEIFDDILKATRFVADLRSFDKKSEVSLREVSKIIDIMAI